MKKMDNIYNLIEAGKSDQFNLVRLAKTKEEVLAIQRQVEDAENHIQVGTLDEKKVDQIIDLMQRVLQQKKNPDLIKALFHLVVQRVTVYNNEIVVALMVSQEGFEPTTHRLEGGCSVQLSY